MQPSHLNAAQLLMSFMDTEQGKVCRKITTSDFSQELDAEQSKLARANSNQPKRAKDIKIIKNHFEIETPPRNEPRRQEASAKRKVKDNDKSFGRRANGKKQARLSKEKAKESLAFTNPVVVEKIIGQLQIPAESRKACMSASDSQGRISLKALSSILNQKGGSGQPKTGQPMVAAEDVQSLVSSLRQTHQDQMKPLSELEVKQNGTYTLEEFRELLDRIAREVAGTESGEGQYSTLDSRVPGQVGSELGEGFDSPSNISPDHVERLSANSIPPFVREDLLQNAGSEGAIPDRISQAEEAKLNELEKAAQQPPAKESKPLESGLNSLQAQDAADDPNFDSRQKLQGSSQDTVSVDRRQAQPEPSPAAHSQPTSTKSSEQIKTENPNIQWDASGKGLPRGDSPSMNLASSLASVVDGKVTVKSVAGNESMSQGTFDPAGNLAESASQGQKVLSSQGSNLASWQQGQEMTGKNQGNSQPASNGGIVEKPGFTLANADQVRIDLQQNQAPGSALPGSQNSATVGAMSSVAGDPLSGGSISCHLASWPEALSYRMRQLHQQGRSQMTLELEPKNLGRLSLRIETHQNNVSAFISTDNEQAKALLLQHSASLRQHLEDQGLQLGQLFVEVREEGSGSRQSFQHEGSAKREGRAPQGAKSLDKSEWDAVSAVYGRKTGQQLISLFA